MNNTSERHIIQESFINEADYYGHLTHLLSYQFATDYVINKNILDYGCGTGYGADILAKKAKLVTAIDISDEAILYAKKNYSSHNLNFKTTSKFKKEEFKEMFDVITSFQVIEHVISEKEFLTNLFELLKPGGFLILTTPNKKNRLFSYIQKPWNVFHIKEYSELELNYTLKKYFTTVEVLNISAKKEFVAHELKRLKKQKIITLPCTLYIYPKPLMLFLLKKQKEIFNLLIKIKNNLKKGKSNNIKSSNFKSNYDIKDMLIGENLPNTTDLLCVCKK